MDRRHWLERVDDELAGAGLTAGVRGRLMEELRDHLEDLSEGRGDMATETEVVQWMGDPVELAAAVVAESRQVSWVRRHSLLVFGLAPVPTISMGVALYVSLLVALGYFATAIGYNEHSFPRAVATAFTCMAWPSCRFWLWRLRSASWEPVPTQDAGIGPRHWLRSQFWGAWLQFN